LHGGGVLEEELMSVRERGWRRGNGIFVLGSWGDGIVVSSGLKEPGSRRLEESCLWLTRGVFMVYTDLVM
jgi:hypothetical protein